MAYKTALYRDGQGETRIVKRIRCIGTAKDPFHTEKAERGGYHWR